VHQNADGLSRRPCMEEECTYYNKKQRKHCCTNKFGRKGRRLENWRKHQLEDPIISMFFHAKVKERRPLQQEIDKQNISANKGRTRRDNNRLR